MSNDFEQKATPMIDGATQVDASQIASAVTNHVFTTYDLVLSMVTPVVTRMPEIEKTMESLIAGKGAIFNLDINQTAPIETETVAAPVKTPANQNIVRDGGHIIG